MRTLSVCRWSLRSVVAMSVVLTIGVAGVSAARVTWSDPIDASTNLPVNNGNIIEAVNSGGPGITINDIEFNEGGLNAATTNSNLVDAFPECCSDNGAPTGADESMAFMLDSHRWLGTNSEPTVATLALQGLETGGEYTIQVYFSDVRSPDGDFKTYFWMGDAGGASETFVRNGPNPDNSSFIGTFTADADMQNIHLVPDGTRLDGVTNHDPGLSGYVLSAVPAAVVPEPSSMLLAGMAVVGVLALRRRRAVRSSAALGMVFLGTVLVINPTGAFAAEINWLPRIDASNNLPVNNGNVIEAVNSGGEEISINGIFFSDGGFDADTIFSNLDEAFPECCSDNGAPTGADENMEVMLDSHRWLSTGGAPTVATLVLENLAVDEDFMIQLYYSDFRPGSFKEYYWAGDNGSISELFTRGTTEDNWSFIGTFTADSDQQRIHLIPNGIRLDGFSNHDPGLSGYVLSILASDDPCDFNSDGLCNTVDIDLLGKEIIAGTNDPSFDVNGDGEVTLADQDQWRADAAAKNGFSEPYLNGDADLDGSVLVGDLNAVGTNWQGSPDPWSSGDFNADGVVDVADLNLLALNWQESIPAAAAGVAVPEPSAIMLLILAVTAGCLARRR